MRKNGRTKAGSQRCKCTDCSLGVTAPRPDRKHDADLRAFLDWLLSGRTQGDMGPGPRALRKRIQWCWNVRPVIPPPIVRHHTVMADGTYMNHGWCLIVAVDGESGEVLGLRWCAHESKAAYMALFSRIPAPDVLITDGLHGAETACNAAWPDTRIQRCLVHVQRNTRADLTSKPRLDAGKELKKLSDRLTKVHDAEQAARWGEALNAWHLRWGDFINERTFARDDPTNPKATRREWWWTHQEVRRCYRRLERLFREGKLFAFLEPALTAGGPVVRTTNRLEGGVNSPLKHVLLDHHGLPEEHMRRACEWVRYMKSGSPDPASLIRPEHRSPARPSPAEEDGDTGAPEYGTGISWDEFHTHVGRRFDC
ncbi:transposase [Bifidobacterium callimiconis]|uniref:Transposase n=2 Tax=Bifidobacterium callimiconis TaxID=2306973 RepID=A0A430FHM4_9BIFI|nr:transposase [Bifidobacterium callimiconis]